MESNSKVSEVDANSILETFINNINKLELLTSQPLSTDNVLQNIIELRAQLSWLRSKLTHLKSWAQKGDDKVEDLNVEDLEKKVLSSTSKVKICENIIALYRDTCLYRSFIQFQNDSEDDNQLQTWEKQVRKLQAYSSQLTNLHRTILHDSKRRDRLLRAYIEAKTEYIKVYEKYESVLKTRREVIEEAEDNETFANIMLQDQIKMKYKQAKVLRHLIQGLIGFTWITKIKNPQTVKKLIEKGFEMDSLPPLHNY